ncbi:hypothetical protein IE81DRAFT_23770 [Ceraceosorus guamensis]|uniref:Uncharacterized protein n=1 Tax=Ceraceosorus guamensis TaxID=1522189 RepID=A0A316VQA4_9BASI|nr:hypothetical protein IE81DRAFT_23770 [Ceraceosorus guamensis]PWN39500.1 hypothetical protein IE81DRAFT_23770 [Ceraceosorus guamensis]
MQNKTLLLAFVGLALSLPNGSFAGPVTLQPRAPPVIETLSDLVRGSRSGLRHRFTPMRSSEEIHLGEARPLRGGYVPGSGKRRMKKVALYGTGLAVVGTTTGVGARKIVQHEREQNRKLAAIRADLQKQRAQNALPRKAGPSPGTGNGKPPGPPVVQDAFSAQSVPSPGAGHHSLSGTPDPSVVGQDGHALPGEAGPSPGSGNGKPPGPPVVQVEEAQDAETMGRKGGSSGGSIPAPAAEKTPNPP